MADLGNFQAMRMLSPVYSSNQWDDGWFVLMSALLAFLAFLASSRFRSLFASSLFFSSSSRISISAFFTPAILSRSSLAKAAAEAGVGRTVGRIRTISSVLSPVSEWLRKSAPSSGMSMSQGTPEWETVFELLMKPPSMMVSRSWTATFACA